MDILNCPLCQCFRLEKIHDRVRHSKDSSILKCRDCGMIFQYPLMPAGEEKDFYEKQFPEYMKKRGAACETDPAAHFEANGREARRRIEYIGEHLHKTSDVLELGSSTGFFIDAIKPLVKSVCGIEPGEQYCDYANGRGIKTYSTLSEIASRKFDVIFSFYVLEHIRNPIDFLNGLKANLNPGGMIIFEVPNVDDILVSFYRTPEILDFYWQLAHYFYYSAGTLGSVFEKAGFKASEIKHSQRYDISNHIHWIKDKKPGGMGRYTDIFSEELNFIYKENLVKKGISDTITIFAKN